MNQPFDPRATQPAPDDTDEREILVPSLALVLLWSASEPDRVGEVAFLPALEERWLGRGDGEADPGTFVLFAPHRPVEGQATVASGMVLGGATISRRQLRLRTTADAIEMETVGQCTTLVNGEACERAVLKPGDLVMLRHEVLLLCVRRSATLPLPQSGLALHAFGEADADGIVGESEAAWLMRRSLFDAAGYTTNVFLEGESGTGKELAARLIHRVSARSGAPFIAQAGSKDSVALRLFGNVAHSGMPETRGVMAAADGGTLLLDQAEDYSELTQVQLLRALQQKQYSPFGDPMIFHSDVRFIAASKEGPNHFDIRFHARFLSKVRLPPLRERREDIPLIVRHLLRERRTKSPALERFFLKGPSGRDEPRVSHHLIAYLVRQPLPHNVFDLWKILSAATDASPGDTLRLPKQVE